jgi:hypothetical protein
MIDYDLAVQTAYRSNSYLNYMTLCLLTSKYSAIITAGSSLRDHYVACFNKASERYHGVDEQNDYFCVVLKNLNDVSRTINYTNERRADRTRFQRNEDP